MSSRTNAITSAKLCLTFATLLLGAYIAGCDRKPEPGKALPPKPAGPAASQPAPQFEVPHLSQAELTALGTTVEMKVASAYSIAREAPQDPNKLAILAAIYYVHDHPLQAAACFRRIAELKPNDPAAYFYLGTAYEKAGQTADAVSAYQHALELGPPYEPHLRRLADALATTDAARAVEYYQRALDMNPDDVLAWSGLGRVQSAQGQREAGLRSILIAANLDPGCAELQRTAAQALRALGRDADAQQYSHMAEVGGPAQPMADPLMDSMLRAGLDAHAVCAEALELVARNHADAARQLVEQIRALPGSKASAAEALGAIAAAQEKWDEAAGFFLDISAADPQAFSAKSNLGETLIHQGKLAEAEQCLRDVLSQHPEHKATAIRFANLMDRLKKPQEIVTVMEAAVAARPFDPVRHSLLSQYYVSAGRNDNALRELRKALELQPDYFPARQQLARLLCAQRQYAEAKAEFEHVLRTNPRFEDGYLYLSTALIQADKDMRGGEKVLRDGLKKVPNSYNLANSLAWVLATSPEAAQRKPDEAVQLAERANVATGSAQYSYLDTLGTAYAAAGRFEDAQRVARQAIEAASRVNAPEIEQLRARLALYEQNQPFREPG